MTGTSKNGTKFSSFLNLIIILFTALNLLQVCTGTGYTSYVIDVPSTNNQTGGNFTQTKTKPSLMSSLKLSAQSEDPESNKIVATIQDVEYPGSRNIPKSPLFYGWFYDQVISDSLRLIGEKYLANCYDFVPEFSSFLDRNMYFANVSDPFAYYAKPADPNTGRVDPYFHTTSKFCGTEPCPEYGIKVSKVLGKRFQMHIVGFFFTKRTYGMRLKLTSDEQDIFEVDDRKNSLQTASDSEILDNEIGNPATINETTVHEYEGYFHSGKVPNHPLYPGIHFEPQPTDFHPTESRAHITFGCAPHVEAQQTGLDLLEIVDLEISGHVAHLDFSVGGADLPHATLRQFWDSEGVEPTFVIYPKEMMIADATFSVYI